MKLIFNIKEQAVEASISEASLNALRENFSPVAVADLLRDVLYDATNAYNDAVDVLHDRLVNGGPL